MLFAKLPTKNSTTSLRRQQREQKALSTLPPQRIIKNYRQIRSEKKKQGENAMNHEKKNQTIHVKIFYNKVKSQLQVAAASYL